MRLRQQHSAHGSAMRFPDVPMQRNDADAIRALLADPDVDQSERCWPNER